MQGRTYRGVSRIAARVRATAQSFAALGVAARRVYAPPVRVGWLVSVVLSSGCVFWHLEDSDSGEGGANTAAVTSTGGAGSSQGGAPTGGAGAEGGGSVEEIVLDGASEVVQIVRFAGELVVWARSGTGDDLWRISEPLWSPTVPYPATSAVEMESLLGIGAKSAARCSVTISVAAPTPAIYECACSTLDDGVLRACPASSALGYRAVRPATSGWAAWRSDGDIVFDYDGLVQNAVTDVLDARKVALGRNQGYFVSPAGVETVAYAERGARELAFRGEVFQVVAAPVDDVFALCGRDAEATGGQCRVVVVHPTGPGDGPLLRSYGPLVAASSLLAVDDRFVYVASGESVSVFRWSDFGVESAPAAKDPLVLPAEGTTVLAPADSFLFIGRSTDGAAKVGRWKL
jgi:hypothetical protein